MHNVSMIEKMPRSFELALGIKVNFSRIIYGVIGADN